MHGQNQSKILGSGWGLSQYWISDLYKKNPDSKKSNIWYYGKRPTTPYSTTPNTSYKKGSATGEFLEIGKYSMCRLYLLCFLLIASLTSFIHSQDVQLEVHQTVLEKFLLALAPIKGSGEYKSPAGPLPYQWEIQNPKVALTNGLAEFTADTAVGISGAKYRTVAKGKGAASYDPITNRLVFQITQAAFSLSISMFGNTLHLADIDITKRLNQKFELDLSTKVNQVIKIKPFGKNDPPRYVRMYSVDPVVKIEPKKIRVYSNVAIVPTTAPEETPTANIPTGNLPIASEDRS